MGAWIASGESQRFLAVLVIATPCPLLLAIPVAIIGAISLSARRSIIIKNQAVLEQVGKCTTLIFDKTGTLTYGRPALTEVLCADGSQRKRCPSRGGKSGALFQAPPGARDSRCCLTSESSARSSLEIE